MPVARMPGQEDATKQIQEDATKYLQEDASQYLHGLSDEILDGIFSEEEIEHWKEVHRKKRYT